MGFDSTRFDFEFDCEMRNRKFTMGMCKSHAIQSFAIRIKRVYFVFDTNDRLSTKCSVKAITKQTKTTDERTDGHTNNINIIDNDNDNNSNSNAKNRNKLLVTRRFSLI